ncbi:hypothetical protein B0T26DRAFT_309964 [Lasiosphaeria miniovina]|uniref:Uncharacterized protein n=1 Tax=Lasiosphaeria miniovina TaxID=1954250 RepID=A0AA40DYV3_9PEZI|nr:uncharacterized protein B0T26DRAFT_309964 [Lasiosphaeria miniovina]KAK0717996.1 hypothetical protein B0T26DRAFT_309964 [Lasiosphaeria miniovina]
MLATKGSGFGLDICHSRGPGYSWWGLLKKRRRVCREPKQVPGKVRCSGVPAGDWSLVGCPLPRPDMGGDPIPMCAAAPLKTSDLGPEVCHWHLEIQPSALILAPYPAPLDLNPEYRDCAAYVSIPTHNIQIRAASKSGSSASASYNWRDQRWQKPLCFVPHTTHNRLACDHARDRLRVGMICTAQMRSAYQEPNHAQTGCCVT